MKHFLLFAAAWMFAATTFGQLTGIVAEVHAIHDTDAIPDIEGMTTYRLYVALTNETDEISAVYGDAATPLSLTSTEGFYQTSLGSNLGWNINSAFYSLFPEVEFDSWVTLGTSNSSEVTGQPNTIGMDEPFTAFDAGGDMIVNSANGGSWFTLFGDTQAQAGPDLKVMIAQLTTSGSFSGTFNVQVFINGNQAESVQYDGIPFSSNEGAVFGCMDPEATNYNADATESGETCLYPCAISLTLDEVNHVSCPGAGDGEIFVSSEGEQLGALFGINGATPNLAVGHFDDLSGGAYTIAVIDGAGCETSIEVEIEVPTPIVLNASLTESVSCAGDSDGVISGSAEGGAGGFQFSLSSDFIDSNTELYFDGLAAGFYTVYVQDANGCVSSSVPISIADPQPLDVSVSGGQDGILDATCSDSEDGIVVVLTLGGAGNQSSMTYSTNGVDFEPGNILFLAGGTYTIYAMDVNGCIGETANQYTVDAPEAIVINVTTTDILCNGDENGLISFSADGGTGDLTYSFAEGDPNDVTMYGDLAPGDYDLVVTDFLGCQMFETITIQDAELVTASATVTPVSCNGETNGSVELIAGGGTNLFEYSADGMDFGSSPIYIDLAPGDYTYYVQDSNGCQDSVVASIAEPDALSVSGSITNDTGAGDGALDIVVDGGNGGNIFSWSGPDGFTSADEDLSGIAAGEYTVTVTDMNGCSVEATFGVPVGVEEWSFLQSAVVSPNPSTGIFQLDLTGAQGEDVLMKVTDVQGRTVWSQTQPQQWGTNRIVLSLEGMAKGLYQLQLSTNDARYSIQLIKQ